jgi:aspartyl-tRNA(Asn)/glutamyl-tRNA(Gln) amidotransferase subunit C
MKIGRDEVRHVAALARLALSADEEEQLAGELEAILGYIETLAELDTENVPPTAHAALDAGPVFRVDEVRNEPRVEELLANAPDRSGSFLRVPNIIE